MKFSTVAPLAFAAAVAHASNPTPMQLAELNAVMEDLKTNLQDYMNLAMDPNSGFSLADMPSGLIQLGMAVGTATDDSYTSMYSDVDFAGVDKMVTMVPWYSSRLKPLIDSLYAAENPAPSTSSASQATPAPAASSSAAPAAGSSTPAPAPVSSAAPSSYAPAPMVNSTMPMANGTTTQTTTHLSTKTSTICDEECHKSMSTATAFKNVTDTQTTTYCPESSLFKNGTSTVTNMHTTTSTVCETCISKPATSSAKPATSSAKPAVSSAKPAVSSAKPAVTSAKSSAGKTTVTTSTIKVSLTSSKAAAPSSVVIQHQTVNGAAKVAAGMGAGVLAAAALLL
ncbi:TIR2 [Nakaseomyces glabratus]|nr:TIR2 [Nakaseomyces glabratus]UCS25240.1 TIR2 [Nakaseomyces glabratus]UCS30470.1 TIR2 [Nakaseomyces glabratus]UCS35699.1 TIR2 [Nakaseomyces glabratus]